MNWQSALTAGFVATVVMTTMMSGSQSLRLTRMSVPFMLGTIFTPDRDRARLLGFVVHLLNGWWIALVYGALFETQGDATWWAGAAMGLVHGIFVLVALMPILPGLHPRMASEQRGPTPTKELEPPGFMALNYGRRTPISVIVSHVVYGIILGLMYQTAATA
ncbi:MAG TPA: hypothetical protein VFC51_04310 [Chloroflexota bacterium]|nr:hypothetical protein [Chloroflexota bacterium]